MKFSAVTLAVAATATFPGAIAFGTSRPSAVSTRANPLFVSSVDKVLNSESSVSPPMIVGDDANGASMACLPFFCRGRDTPDVDELPLGVKLTGGAKLHKEGLTGKGIKVAVIDDGISAAHPEFDGRVVQQTWFHTDPIGDHGTHVAGTIHMMAPDADIYDYRALGGNGSGSYETITNAVNEAVADGCHIINMSLGGPSPNHNLFTAIRDATKKGVIVVCAAGNEGDGNPLSNESSWPGNFRQVINVGAVAKKDGLPTARFSNSNSEVDYAGIGVDVKSFQPGGKMQSLSGTSMASPHVCGFITALMTKGGEYDNIIKGDASLRELLNEKFVFDIGSKGTDQGTGLGFLTYLSEEEFEGGYLDLPDFD